MSVLIGADLVPTLSNYESFAEGDIYTLFGEKLVVLLKEADYRIFNLETPLTDIEAPIDKCGPALITPTRVMPGFKAAGVDLFTLANNHIMDQGQQGYDQTVALLRENQIAYVGAGGCLAEAARPHVFEYAGKQIGVYACAEHEFSIATENLTGANPFDPLESLDHVAELKTKCDYVIVLYHGGKEHYRYPSPNLQKVCRKLVEKGADLVICQHSHCIGCMENYQDSTIVYGQGNFLFDYNDSKYWQTSLLISLNEKFEISFIPLVKEAQTVRLANADQAKYILDEFNKRSIEILAKGFVEEKYCEFAQSMLSGYLLTFSGIKLGFFFRAFNKLSGYRFGNWYFKNRFSKAKRLAIQNFIECEAHRELLIGGCRHFE